MPPNTLSWRGPRKQLGINALPCCSTSLLSATALIQVLGITPVAPPPKSRTCRTSLDYLIFSLQDWYTPMAHSQMLSARSYYPILSTAVYPESKLRFPALPVDVKKFSERLSFCMKQSNVNGAELSALSGVTTATISRYLNGLRTPTVKNIILLAKALGVSVDYLLGLHDVPDDKILTAAYSTASSADKHVIWTLLERYGGKHETTTDR